MNELNNDQNVQEIAEEHSSFNFQAIFKALILNWKWFLLSIIICVGLGLIYLRYTTPVYNVTAKLLVKDDNSDKRSGGGTLQALESMSNLGIISNNYGIENGIAQKFETLVVDASALFANRRGTVQAGYFV